MHSRHLAAAGTVAPPLPGCSAHDGAPMTTGALDPLIHVPARLRVMVTLAALPDGDTLSFTRVNVMTTIALTHDGRGALDRYTAVLRQLLDTAEPARQR
jgi:hypothetical protein